MPRTQVGRIVYDRPTHVFKLTDATRVVRHANLQEVLPSQMLEFIQATIQTDLRIVEYYRTQFLEQPEEWAAVIEDLPAFLWRLLDILRSLGDPFYLRLLEEFRAMAR